VRRAGCKTRERSHAEVIGSLSAFLITFSLYGGGGFLAVDTAAPGLYGLEATFEYGTVVAFKFDLVDHAAGVYPRCLKYNV
jgi:hypothetical protein